MKKHTEPAFEGEEPWFKGNFKRKPYEKPKLKTLWHWKPPLAPFFRALLEARFGTLPPDV